MSAAGSAVAMIGANLRFGSGSASNSSILNNTRHCPPGGAASAAALLALSGLGMSANLALMTVILSKKQLRRWSHGLLFHQAIVDCARAAILLPLGIAVFKCQPVYKCSLVETAFLLLVTVSTVNMLTTVLNDSPIFPENEEEQADLSAPLLMDSPQCVLFGTFMIWFASITINLGPTFLSGALAASAGSYGSYGPAPSCPLVRGPFRHYVLNALWIGVNAVCVGLTLFHLKKLHRDLTKANVEAVRVAGLVTTLVSMAGDNRRMDSLPNSVGPRTVDGGLSDGHSRPGGSANLPLGGGRRLRGYLARVEREGVRRVRMFLVITAAYVLFWGPLFLITLLHHPALTSHIAYELYFQITLHISYVHAAVNPLLFMALHRALRRAALQLCCGCCVHWSQFVLALTAAAQSPLAPSSFSPAAASPEPPPAPPPPMAPPAPSVPAPPGPPTPHTMMTVDGGLSDGHSRPGGSANLPLGGGRRLRGYLARVEREGVRRVRMFLVITAAYVLFWGPLFLITLLHHPALTSHIAYELYFQITLHISYVHAAVNPLLFMALHRALRRAALQLCCGCCVHWSQFVLALTAAAQSPLAPSSFSPAAASPEPPPAPPPPMAPPAPSVPAPPGPPTPHTMMGDEDLMAESWSGSVRRPPRSPSPLLPAI